MWGRPGAQGPALLALSRSSVKQSPLPARTVLAQEHTPSRDPSLRDGVNPLPADETVKGHGDVRHIGVRRREPHNEIKDVVVGYGHRCTV
jgi:hypothetical protein